MQLENGIYFKGVNETLSYPEKGNDFCFSMEEDSFWFNHRNRVIRSALERVPFRGNFADIGGGNGYQVKYLQDIFSDTKFYLVEPGYNGCRNAVERGVREVYCMPFSDFPFAENSIGAAGLFDVIEHIKDDLAFLSELRNVLPGGTVLYITTPAYQSLWSDVDEYSGHYRRYTKKSIRRLLDQSGWKTTYVSYFFKWLPPLVWVMRCLPNKLAGNRKFDRIERSESKFHKHSPVMKPLAFMHRNEPDRILKSSINFGSSLLAIAIKKDE